MPTETPPVGGGSGGLVDTATATPTQTATATPDPTETPTEAATDMPTDTPTDGATGPGFTLVVALLALPSTALLAIRRERKPLTYCRFLSRPAGTS